MGECHALLWAHIAMRAVSLAGVLARTSIMSVCWRSHASDAVRCAPHCLQQWTNKCNFSHDVRTLTAKGYGENLTLGTSRWQQVRE